MRIKPLILLSGLLIGAAVNAAPAPVDNLNSLSLAERVAILERTLQTRNNAQQNIQMQLDEMQLEVNELRGAVELHTHKLEQILQRQRELYLEIDKQVEAALSQTAQVTPQPTEPVEQSVAPVTNTVDEDAAYEEAIGLVNERKYEEAIPKFKAYLESFPNSKLTPNAHYWLGQLLFSKREWGEAEKSFDQVVRFYPDSNKRAQSILKLGEISQKRSNNARAIQLFEQVVSEYPNASERRLAETRLRSLRQNQ